MFNIIKKGIKRCFICIIHDGTGCALPSIMRKCTANCGLNIKSYAFKVGQCYSFWTLKQWCAKFGAFASMGLSGALAAMGLSGICPYCSKNGCPTSFFCHNSPCCQKIQIRTLQSYWKWQFYHPNQLREMLNYWKTKIINK